MKQKNRVKSLLILLVIMMLGACGGETTSPTVEPETVEEAVEDVETAEEVVEEAEEVEVDEVELAEEEAVVDEEVEEVDEVAVEEETAVEPTAEPIEEPISEPTANLTDECVTEYDESVDYFPSKVEVTYADGFAVEYHNNYKIVTVLTPFVGAEEVAQYVLVQCGTPVPDGFDGLPIIEVPINSIVAMSTTYLPVLEVLGVVDTLVGVDNGLYASNETVRTMISAGDVAEISSGADVNVEVAIDLDADVIMTYASGSADFDSQPKLEEAGLTVVLNSEYLDTQPLGQAEWVDFMALFYNEEATAENWFAELSADYEALKGLTADIEERPTVFSNSPFDGTWYLPGGASYTAQLFEDAGADFVWADDESTGSLFLDFETVFEKAADADYWLNIGFFGTLDDLAAADSRYAEFSAFQEGNVFNNDVRTNEFGGNDFYESGVVFPNVVLADLIKIFHPELLPDHEFVYYRVVE